MKTLYIVFLAMMSVMVIHGANNCLDFNGTTDFVNCGSGINSQISNQITISAWVYPEFNQYGDRGIVTNYWYDGGIKGGAGLFAWTTSGDNHKWTGFLATQSGSYQQLSSPEEIVLNQWTHIALTYDNNTARLFLNGKEVVTSNCGPGYLEDPSNNNPFYIAKHSYSANFNNCKIDEVQIWNIGLSAAEIKQDMYKTRNGDETGLVAYYQFNESSGSSLPDITSNNYNGTITGAVLTTGVSLRNESNALDFDGTDDYVLLDDRTLFTGLTSLTLEAWIYPTASSGWHEIFQVYPNNITLALSGSALYGFINDNAPGDQASIQIGGAVNIDEWNHVAMTWNTDGNHILYSNGKEIGRITNASTDALVAGTGGPYIGALVANNELFQGNIDELRIWNDVRTPDELQENMCKELTGTENGLIGYYTFNQTFGSQLLDITSSNNHGTLTNMDDSDWVDSEAFTTWTGRSSTVWESSDNWTDGVPSATDNVGIYTSSNNPIISGNPEVDIIYVGSAASVSLSSSLTVNTLCILDDDLDLNGQTITLGSSGTLIENSGRLYGSTGTITTTRTLGTVANENVGGLGAEITTTTSLGETTITRSHTVQSGAGNMGIQRYYDIVPATNSELDATLVFHYDDTELNGKTEGNLMLFRSTDGGTTWNSQGGTVDTGANTITLSGIDAFSRWTASDSEHPLPVTLSSFSALFIQQPKLFWTTQSENGNAGWNVWRSNEAEYVTSQQISIDLIPGAGTTTTPTEYQFTDQAAYQAGCQYYYWLESISIAGESELHGPVTLTIPQGSMQSPPTPQEYGLMQNHPNPFNPCTEISFVLPSSAHCTVDVYDVSGRTVTTLIDEVVTANVTHTVIWHGDDAQGNPVASGIYFYKMRAGKYTATKKMILMK